MTGFINSLDGSKLAIIGSFLLALGAMLFIGFHLTFADGTDAPAEIQFLEQVVKAVLLTGGGISTVHVVTGAIVNAKTAKAQLQQTGAPPSA